MSYNYTPGGRGSEIVANLLQSGVSKLVLVLHCVHVQTVGDSPLSTQGADQCHAVETDN
jgi:hypothetical protein